jgi:hypothetical protein
MSLHNLAAAAVSVSLAAVTSAEYIIVDDIGGSVDMHARPIDGLIDPGSTVIAEDDLAQLHTDLNFAGIDTDNKITFLLAETEGGLTFIALIDSNMEQQPGQLVFSADQSLVMSTAAPSTLNRHVNAEPEDSTFWADGGNGIQNFDALFHWDMATEADAFAWSNLATGDAVSFHFTDINAAMMGPGDPFQFLSWGRDGWEVVATDDFSSNDQFVFSFNTVIPAPGALGVFALAGLCGRRRRRG